MLEKKVTNISYLVGLLQITYITERNRSFLWDSQDEVKPEKVGLNLNKKQVINNFYLSVITKLNYKSADKHP